MIYVSTHSGKQHDISEDAVLAGSLVLSDTSAVFPMPDCGFVCVADGVGGNLGGAQASRFILNILSRWDAAHDIDLKAYLSEINHALIEKSRMDPSVSGMASTLTGFLFSDRNPVLIHVGNTRAYIRQGKYLKQITPDHTTYNWLIKSGQIEAAERCNKSEITNCFGGGNATLLSKLYITQCQPFSLALLTSDGIHEYLDLDTLEEVLMSDGSYVEKCEELIEKAVKAGSEDDLSVVIICASEE